MVMSPISAIPNRNGTSRSVLSAALAIQDFAGLNQPTMTHRITVVEDDAAFISLLKYNLEFHKYVVECISSGSEAQVRFASAPFPDLVVLDWILPGLHGTEVLRQLRRQILTQHIPVVMFTCRADQPDKDRAFKLGVTDFLSKTAPLATLIARIRCLVAPFA